MVNADNPSSRGIYLRIFEGVRNGDQLRAAIAQAVRELRASMEKDDNPAVTKAHVRNLQDLDARSLAAAYTLAERNCIYWPSPGQMRELAGHSEKDEAARALDWVLAYLQEHGANGKPKGGAVSFGNDGAGRRVLVEVQPMVEPPELPVLILRSLTRLGGGSTREGLFYCSHHPSVTGWEETISADSPHRTAERIERQWARCYQQELRETPHQ